MGWSSPSRASHSTVRTSAPSSCTAKRRQERTGSPSSSTVHAPHTPCSQPRCVPVSSRSWRRKSARVLRLKRYFTIQDRDDPRGIREKVTGRLLTLDAALQPTLPAFLARLDVSADDAAWRALDPPQRRQRILEAVRRLLLREA